jgi:hypothetical protein
VSSYRFRPFHQTSKQALIVLRPLRHVVACKAPGSTDRPRDTTFVASRIQPYVVTRCINTRICRICTSSPVEKVRRAPSRLRAGAEAAGPDLWTSKDPLAMAAGMRLLSLKQRHVSCTSVSLPWANAARCTQRNPRQDEPVEAEP